MKKWLPWLITGLMAAWVLATLRPQPQKDFHLQAFSRLPVLLNGRIQPWDSVARNALLQIRTKQSVRLDDGRTLSAIQWAVELMLNPSAADDYRVFRIDFDQVTGLLKLPESDKHFSFKQLEPHLAEIEKQAERAGTLEPAVRSAFEKQMLRLYNALVLYQRLKNSLRPEITEDFSQELANYLKAIPAGAEAIRAREAGNPYDQAAFDRMVGFLGQFDRLSRMAYPLAIPPFKPTGGREQWVNLGASLLESARVGEIHPAVTFYAQMVGAYRAGQADAFNRAVAEYGQWLQQPYLRELTKGKRESVFNQLQLFYKATVIYTLAFVLGCLFWFNWADWLRRSAYGLLGLAAVLHTVGILFRMVLEGRPPVTNLYSSAVFIGWGAAVLGLFLERAYRDGIGVVTASCVGFITQIVAHNLALGGDTMEMMRAVLDTNFWLATHVITITLGYSATFIAGFLGIVYIVRGVATATLSPATSQALERMVYGILCFATLFSFAGTVLGGIWADQSWGRFWGWDPKENGALIIVLWNALILHARWDGLVRERGLMNLAIFGNIITSFSWFGVNMLGIGLHSYGFMDSAMHWLLIFIASQLAIIALGFLPLAWWRSFRKAPASRRA